MNESNKAPEFSAPAEAARMTVNQQHLKQAWDTSQVSTKEDWLEWMHRLSVEFMKESPSHALRACMSLVDVHPPLAKELFNAAFISCWRDLYEQYQVRCYLCFRKVKGDLKNENYRKTLSALSTLRLRRRPHLQSLYTGC
jgi:phosphatidylinositol kinase/protein kinase (PI-3  family)